MSVILNVKVSVCGPWRRSKVSVAGGGPLPLPPALYPLPMFTLDLGREKLVKTVRSDYL